MDQLLGSRYVLHGLLGRGAMGQVYRASVRDSDAQVAVKVLKPELVSDPEVVARFFQERSILTSIAHPHVVRVSDLVVEGETLGIVMELVQGTDLRRFLRERGTLAPAQAVGLVCQLLDGLAAVHAAGIVHRDVKPENVLVDLAGGQPVVRLTDFGVARLSYGGSLTKLSSLIGTPEYMAPELAAQDRATPAADLYSAGVVLYELLCGRTPFAGANPMTVLHRHLHYPPPPIPGLPPALWAQVAALLAKDPVARPPSAAQAAMALSSLAGSLGGLPPLPAMAEPGPEVWTPAGADAAAMVPAAADGSGTVLRRRDRGAAAGGAQAAGGPGRRRARGGRRPVLIALPAALVVLAAAIGVVVLRSQSAPAPVSEVSYAFAPQQFHNGLLAVRHWALGGAGGSLLTERVTLSSATGKPVQAAFEEAIPVAIARSVQTLSFTPRPAKIVQADPVVEWVVQLPAQGLVTVGYQARVPSDGASRARLLRWARALAAIQSRVTPDIVTVQLRSLTVTPKTIRLAPGRAGQLRLSGLLANGRPAPAGLLSAAAWTSADATVAGVSQAGLVTAVAAGASYVTAQIGTTQVTVPVTVAGGLPNVAGGTGSGTVPVAPGPGAITSPGSSGGNGGQGVSPPTPHVTTAAPPPTTAPPPPPPPPASYTYYVYHTCANGACGLNLHTGPGYTSYTRTRTLVDGDAVQIVCQTRGESVSGIDGTSSNVWDKTVQGDYAADYYIDTPGTLGSFSPPIPQC